MVIQICDFLSSYKVTALYNYVSKLEHLFVKLLLLFFHPLLSLMLTGSMNSLEYETVSANIGQCQQ